MVDPHQAKLKGLNKWNNEGLLHYMEHYPPPSPWASPSEAVHITVTEIVF